MEYSGIFSMGEPELDLNQFEHCIDYINFDYKDDCVEAEIGVTIGWTGIAIKVHNECELSDLYDMIIESAMFPGDWSVCHGKLYYMDQIVESITGDEVYTFDED